MSEYNLEVTRCRDQTIIKRYEVPIRTDRKFPLKKPRKKFEDMSREEQEVSLNRREKYFQGRIRHLKKVAHENDFSLFITLTFGNQIEDPVVARKEFRLYIKRMRYRFPELFFLAVPERQKNRRMHFHILLGGVSFIEHRELQEKIWGRGFCFIERVKPGTRIVDYIFKYLVKGLDNGREPWQKVYCSRNLKKPKVEKIMTADTAEDIIFDNLESVVSDGVYIVTQETGIPINRCEVITIQHS